MDEISTDTNYVRAVQPLSAEKISSLNGHINNSVRTTLEGVKKDDAYMDELRLRFPELNFVIGEYSSILKYMIDVSGNVFVATAFLRNIQQNLEAAVMVENELGYVSDAMEWLSQGDASSHPYTAIVDEDGTVSLAQIDGPDAAGRYNIINETATSLLFVMSEIAKKDSSSRIMDYFDRALVDGNDNGQAIDEEI